MAFDSKDIIDIFNKVKYPYNINLLTQQKAMDALNHTLEVSKWVSTIILERSRLMDAFTHLPSCVKVYPSNANFFLTEMIDANDIYNYLVNRGIIVRNRSRVSMCNNCLRITIGTKAENNELLAALRIYDIENKK